MSETQDVEALALKIADETHRCSRPCEEQEDCEPRVNRAAKRIEALLRPAIEERDKEIERLRKGFDPTFEVRDKRIAELEAENTDLHLVAQGIKHYWHCSRHFMGAGSPHVCDRCQREELQAIQDHAAPLSEALRDMCYLVVGTSAEEEQPYRDACAALAAYAAALSSFDAYTQGQTAQRSE